MATALLTGAGVGTRRGGEGVVWSALKATGGERSGRVRVREGQHWPGERLLFVTKAFSATLCDRHCARKQTFKLWIQYMVYTASRVLRPCLHICRKARCACVFISTLFFCAFTNGSQSSTLCLSILTPRRKSEKQAGAWEYNYMIYDSGAHLGRARSKFFLSINGK